MENVVVTGGAGFIGSNLVHELVARGTRVRVIDNLATGRRENLAEVEKDVEFIEADIRDLDALERAFLGFDYVLHQAALGSVPRSIDNPQATNETNLSGTLNVLLAAKRQGMKKVVYASSSSIYGNRNQTTNGTTQAKREMMKPMPLSPYAVSKLAGEHYVKVFSHVYGLPTVSLRYFNVFGPRQDPASQYAAVIPRFITAMLRNEPPTIFGDGEQSRDFTFVDNVVEANLLAMRSELRDGETLNIACGQRITLLELVRTLNTLFGTSLQPKIAPSRPADVRHSLADIEKARRLMHYNPTVPFAEGLRKTVEWFKTRRNP